MSKKREEALEYHSRGRKGKIEVTATKPLLSQRDLSLAYTPGVAEPCRDINKDPELAYDYTAKGNLVAVITNGTAVLGLGNIGALAGKPVMEGKANLFKKFADIDVFDIEVDATDVEEFIAAVRAIAPTFGGINLEDIRAPECFEIERRLQADLDIPVFHDDQQNLYDNYHNNNIHNLSYNQNHISYMIHNDQNLAETLTYIVLMTSEKNNYYIILSLHLSLYMYYLI